jgi:hypothetical protein
VGVKEAQSRRGRGTPKRGEEERDTQTGWEDRRRSPRERERHTARKEGKETRSIAEGGTQTWNQSQMCVEKKRESDGEIEGGRRKSVRGGDSDMQRRRRRRRWWSRGKSSAELSAERGPGIRRRRLHVQFARTSQNV